MVAETFGRSRQFSFKLGRAAAMLAGAALGLAFWTGAIRFPRPQATPPGMGRTTPVVTPEELLGRQWVAGAVDAARQGFRALLGEHLSPLRGWRAHPPKNREDFSRYSSALSSVMYVFDYWQGLEAVRFIQGNPIPEDVVEEFASVALAALEDAQTLQVSGRERGNPFNRDIKTACRTVTKTLVLLREVGHGDPRDELFGRLKTLQPGPTTLAAFDGQRTDVGVIFGCKQLTTSRPAAGGPARRLLRDDDPLVTFLRRYYEAKLSGELDRRRSFFVPGYWDGREPPKIAPRPAGWKLYSLGHVWAEGFGHDEVEVQIGQLHFQLPDGSIKRSFATVIVRCTGDEYRIAYLGTRECRAQGIVRND
jgi:hypothetical protein